MEIELSNKIRYDEGEEMIICRMIDIVADKQGRE